MVKLGQVAAAWLRSPELRAASGRSCVFGWSPACRGAGIRSLSPAHGVESHHGFSGGLPPAAVVRCWHRRVLPALQLAGRCRSGYGNRPAYSQQSQLASPVGPRLPATVLFARQEEFWVSALGFGQLCRVVDPLAHPFSAGRLGHSPPASARSRAVPTRGSVGGAAMACGCRVGSWRPLPAGTPGRSSVVQLRFFHPGSYAG